MTKSDKKEWLGHRYSKQEINLGIAFLNKGIKELQRVNSLLISPTIQHFRMSVSPIYPFLG